jgi:predicted small metal-binding protein
MASQSASSLKDMIEIKSGAMQHPCMSFCCNDIGNDCWFEAQGFSKTEIMRKFIEHAKKTHKMDFLSAEIILKVDNVIKK